jgi:hypothetical protein
MAFLLCQRNAWWVDVHLHHGKSFVHPLIFQKDIVPIKDKTFGDLWRLQALSREEVGKAISIAEINQRPLRTKTYDLWLFQYSSVFFFMYKRNHLIYSRLSSFFWIYFCLHIAYNSSVARSTWTVPHVSITHSFLSPKAPAFIFHVMYIHSTINHHETLFFCCCFFPSSCGIVAAVCIVCKPECWKVIEPWCQMFLGWRKQESCQEGSRVSPWWLAPSNCPKWGAS